MKIKKLRIFDMDGTIVCSLHRYRTIVHADGVEKIDLAYWRENEHKAMNDSLLPLAEYYKQCLTQDDTYVIIATARVLNSPDRQFIREVLGEPNYIISRAANDTRSGGLLKIIGLQKFYNLPNFREAWETNARFYEDNTSYLRSVCDHFGIQSVYIPSKQGH